MTDYETPWTYPSQVKQDNTQNKFNPGKCYSFEGLDNLKKKTNNYAQIINRPGSWGGVRGGDKKNIRHSPRLYCYDYNFNIPSNATITALAVRTVVREGFVNPKGIKTTMLKLKTTSSTTDEGTGNNLANNDKWKHNPQWNEYFIKKTPKEWGVALTPAMVNNSNFGLIFQCAGTSSGWTQPQIWRLQLVIYYTVPNVIPDEKLVPEFTLTTRILKSDKTLPASGRDPPELSDDTPPLPIIQYSSSTDNQLLLEITYTQKAIKNIFPAGNTPEITLHANGLLLGSNKKETITVSTKQVPRLEAQHTNGVINNTPTITEYIPIRPTAGAKISTITLTAKKNPTVTHRIFTWAEDQSEVDDPDQKVIIQNNEFSHCTAYKGGAWAVINKDQYQVMEDNIYTNTNSDCNCEYYEDLTQCPHIIAGNCPNRGKLKRGYVKDNNEDECRIN